MYPTICVEWAENHLFWSRFDVNRSTLHEDVRKTIFTLTFPVTLSPWPHRCSSS